MNKIQFLYKIFIVITLLMFGSLFINWIEINNTHADNNGSLSIIAENYLLYDNFYKQKRINDDLLNKNNLLGDAINELYRTLMNDNININNIPNDSIKIYLNKILNLIPDIPPIEYNNKIIITSKFGYRIHPIKNQTLFHKGVDIKGIYNTPIIATMSGIVVKIDNNAGYGNYIIIKNSMGFQTLYSHLNKIYVNENDWVDKHQKIGTLGKTGMITNIHLHYEIYQSNELINPINNTFIKYKDKISYKYEN